MPQGLVFVAVGIEIGIAFGIEIAIDEHSDLDADTDSDPEISRITSIFRADPGIVSIKECTPDLTVTASEQTR